MAKNSYYTVWVGRKPGVYPSWPEAREQVDGFSGALFKGFICEDVARHAFGQGHPSMTNYLARTRHPGLPTGTYLAVDAFFDREADQLQWRGVLVTDSIQTEVFRSPVYQGGSANAGEFLAIIEGLRYLTDHLPNVPLYSDAHNADQWVRDGAHRITHYTGDELLVLLCEGNNFLHHGGYERIKEKTPLLGWVTKHWGVIPAGFDWIKEF